MTASGFRGALYIDQFYSHDEVDESAMQPVDEETPVIRNVMFSNIDLKTAAGNAVYIMGLPDMSLKNRGCFLKEYIVKSAGESGGVIKSMIELYYLKR